MRHETILDARALTTDLGGVWSGTQGTAPCPICQPERRRDQRALSLRDGVDGRLLVHCHKAGCAFPDLVAALGTGFGAGVPPDPDRIPRRAAETKAQADRRSLQALECWKAAGPIAGTPVETYLRSRAITAPLPDTLRFHPEAWHGPTARRHPAMVARVDGVDGVAVHRTYLTAGGHKASVPSVKMMLGATAGGAVHVATDPVCGTGNLVVAEGIETALSLASGLLSGPATVWAALSASGVAALRLPNLPGRLLVASDSDDGGVGQRSAHALAVRADALGWRVSLLPAPEDRDWNDVLIGKGGAR